MRPSAFLLLLLPAAAVAAPCSPQDAAVLRELKLETWPELYRRQDVAGLDALLLDGARTVDESGAVTGKADEIAWLRDNAWQAQDFRYRIDVLECFGDTALIIGEGASTHDEGGRAMRSSYVSSNVFVRSAGRWRVAMSHLAPAKSAPVE